MKKLFLLLAAGSIAMNVGAQERKPIAVDGPQKMNFDFLVKIFHNSQTITKRGLYL